MTHSFTSGVELPELNESICVGYCLTFHKCFEAVQQLKNFIVTVQGVQREISEFRSKSWNFTLVVLNGNDNTSPCFKFII